MLNKKKCLEIMNDSRLSEFKIQVLFMISKIPNEKNSTKSNESELYLNTLEVLLIVCNGKKRKYCY